MKIVFFGPKDLCENKNKLLLQSDVVFDSESNNCNFSSQAPPDGKKYFQFFHKFLDPIIFLNPAVRYLHSSAFFAHWSPYSVGSIKIQKFLHRNVNFSRNLKFEFNFVNIERSYDLQPKN